MRSLRAREDAEKAGELLAVILNHAHNYIVRLDCDPSATMISTRSHRAREKDEKQKGFSQG